MKFQSLRRTLFFLAVGMMVVLVAACTGQEQVAPSPTAPPMTDTSIQFSWVHTIEFGGFYMARDKGYYAQQGLNVRLDAGGFDENGNYISPIDRVTSGASEFGVVGGDILLQARESGQPVVAIATIYQLNPVGFVSLADANITKPQDMVGHTIAIDLNSATGLVYRALLAAENIAFDSVTVVARKDFSNDQLLNGEVDMEDSFVTNQPVQIRQGGHEINVVLASDYGIELYSNVIFTTEDMVKNHPDRVERFLRATLQGFDAAVAEPDAAAALSVALNDTLSLDSEKASMQASLPLMNPTGSHPGMMTAEAWQYTHDLLVREGLLSESQDVTKAYDLSFLQKIYGNS